MNLRDKILLTIVATLSGLIAILAGSASQIVLNSFKNLEKEDTENNLKRVQEALYEEYHKITTTAKDWGSWNGLYDYTQKPNREFYQQNLLPATFQQLDLQLMMIINTKNQVIFGQNIAEKGQYIPLKKTEKFTAFEKDLLTHRTPQDIKTGLITFEDHLMIIVSKPILTSEEQGPIQGTLLMGRYLNDDIVKALSSRTRLPIQSYALFTPQKIPPSLYPILKELQKKINAQEKISPMIIYPKNEKTITGYTLFSDLQKKPVLLLQVDLPRRIYQQGKKSVHYLLIAVIALGITVTILIIILLDKLVISRILKLSQEVQLIGETKNLELRVTLLGKDELGGLGKTINWMLEKLDRSNQELAKQREKAENLLLNILPSAIAESLKEDSQTIADDYPSATILFADIVGFTQISGELSPAVLVKLLNEIFSKFDQLTDKYHLEKIKTIGDAYMVVGGVPKPDENHAHSIANMALEMISVMEVFNQETGKRLNIRVGINTGSVVAGVIGLKKFIYDLWGDAVNVASRMESSGLPGRIQVTENTYNLIKDDFVMEYRGSIEIKGKGQMVTYWLLGNKP